MVAHEFRGLEDLSPGKVKRDSKSYVYFLAAIAGVTGAALLIGGLKIGLILAVAMWKFLKDYWIWVAVGIVLLLFLRKILSRKRVEVHKDMQPDYPGY